MKRCKICGIEMDFNSRKIYVCLDNKLESFCMGCERKIHNYIEKSGKKRTPFIPDDEWKDFYENMPG